MFENVPEDSRMFQGVGGVGEGSRLFGYVRECSGMFPTGMFANVPECSCGARRARAFMSKLSLVVVVAADGRACCCHNSTGEDQR